MANTYTHGDWYYPGRLRQEVATPPAPIKLAHIDTGFCAHPCVAGQFNEDETQNYITGPLSGNSPKVGGDQLRTPADAYGGLFKDHGLATGSFIIGKAATANDDARTALDLSGMLSSQAAYAQLLHFIPMRVCDGVELTWPDSARVANAVRWAADNGCHVISMSLGWGKPSLMREAFTYARQKGVIICCASGQGVPMMFYPGKFSLERLCICCGPSQADGQPWTGHSISPSWSMFGPGYVTICAPGAQMPKAYYERRASKPWQTGYNDFVACMKESEGSSYSTAYVASAAVLWLAQWHAELATFEITGTAHVMSLFRLMVEKTLTPFSSFPNDKHGNPLNPPSKYGPGIINIAGLLATAPTAEDNLMAQESGAAKTAPTS